MLTIATSKSGSTNQHAVYIAFKEAMADHGIYFQKVLYNALWDLNPLMRKYDAFFNGNILFNDAGQGLIQVVNNDGNQARTYQVDFKNNSFILRDDLKGILHHALLGNKAALVEGYSSTTIINDDFSVHAQLEMPIQIGHQKEYYRCIVNSMSCLYDTKSGTVIESEHSLVWDNLVLDGYKDQQVFMSIKEGNLLLVHNTGKLFQFNGIDMTPIPNVYDILVTVVYKNNFCALVTIGSCTDSNYKYYVLNEFGTFRIDTKLELYTKDGKFRVQTCKKVDKDGYYIPTFYSPIILEGIESDYTPQEFDEFLSRYQGTVVKHSK